MAIFFVFLAGAFVSLSNLCMRKSIDSGGTTKAFLVFQMTMAFAVAVFVDPIRKSHFSPNFSIACLGILAGFILAGMLSTLGRALEKGPPGFTFSILNAATVMPGIVMALLFGAALGFLYTPWHALGSFLVVAGLFWAGRELKEIQEKKMWILLCAAMFFLHVFLLILFQWRALLLNLPHPEELTRFFTAEQIKNSWFMPFMYLTAAVVQLAVYLRTEKRVPKFEEAVYGILGGAANCLCSFFLIWATEAATALENAVIFPFFSIVGIILSNFWGQKLYKEQVNWKAWQLCAFGLLIGMVNWKTVAAVIGF